MCMEEKQEELKTYWTDFVKYGMIRPQVRSFIADSWLRCWNYGIKEELEEEIPEGYAQQILTDNQLLIDIAWPFLLKMKELVAGSQYAITLHDRECRLLARVFAGDLLVFEKSSFDIGAQWSEERMGTAGPNACIRQDRELQVVGAEHYNRRLAELTCSSAPIHDKYGVIVGCINMTGRCSDSNSHTLGLVSAMAFAIEKHLELATGIKTLDDTFSVISDGVIVLDDRFHVSRASQFVCSLLKISMQELKAIDLRTLLPADDFEMRLGMEKEPFTYPEYRLKIGSRSIVCTVTVLPIWMRGQNTGTVIFLRESRVMSRLANHFVGNRARYSFSDILTEDEGLRTLMGTMEGIAKTDCSVLLEGESGTGKELFAHSLHSASSRFQGPFVVVNCASLPRSLVESELFGYEKGSFTGANSAGNPGKFELADGGTIFLDEIGELPLEIQAKLLRVLDNHRIMRIGGRTERPLDVRVVAATNRNLYEEVQNRNFRADLYFRINVVKFDIPPLRRRGGDALLLAENFLRQINNKEGQQKRLGRDFREAVRRYPWPGNVRELQNAVVRAFYCSVGEEIGAQDLPAEVLEQISSSEEETLRLRGIEAFERQEILEALEQSHGDVVAAGKSLGISKSTIYRRIKKYKIDLG